MTGSFWPNERQVLLLRAALTDGDEGVEAWRRVRDGLDLDTLESESLVLLPLVQRQLATAAVDDPLLPRLRGIHRRTWYVNQLRLDRLTPTLRVVHGVGADPLVVGSFELPVQYYGDLGARAVNGLYLLVRPEAFERSLEAVAGEGWKPGRRGRDWVSFVGSEGDECVVRRRLFDEFPELEQPAPLWDATVAFDLNGVEAAGLAPSDELLNVSLTGARMRPWPSLVWLADAVTVLRAAGSAVDWSRVVERATELRATMRLREALVFLRAELDAPVPEGVIEELERVPVNKRDVLAHRLAARRWPLVGAAPETATRFLGTTAECNPLLALLRLPAFLRDEWNLERRSQVPLAAARKGAARFRVRRQNAVE